MLNLELTTAQNAVYRDLSKNVTAKNGSSVDSILNFIRFGCKMVQNKSEEINAKIRENNDKLSLRLASEANMQLQQELQKYTNDVKAVLTKRTNAFFVAKREAIARYIKQIPSDSLGKKLQYIKEFGHLFTNEIWEIFITDPDIAGNFFASSIMQKIAEEHGIDYVSGFNYNRLIENLNSIKAMVDNSIPHIGENDDNLMLLSLMSENPNSPLAKMVNDIDTDIATIIPAERRTVVERLKEAEKHAYNTDNIRLSARIKVFLENHVAELSTPEELKEELYSQAENYIQQGMNAKKGDE